MKMERILLVEPNYKNKYPPIGLMKISTYYQKKGDYVEFHKGLMPETEAKLFDKVLITTLFTFDFSMCIQTIQYYIAIVGIQKVFVGGIAATIMPEKFLERIPDLKLNLGQLTSSRMLGYDDDENIDIMELDYDILWDVSYEYAAADSYFIYTTRGCPRKCSFCAVKTLEPDFYDCDNICDQINNVNKQFGIKKQLLIMDNNILYSNNFRYTVEILKGLGFGRDNNKIRKNNNMKYYLNSLDRRIRIGKKYDALLARIKKVFLNLKFARINKADAEVLKKFIDIINADNEEKLISTLYEEYDFLNDFFERYNYHMITRYVDFNQGLDARLFDDEKAKQLSELAVKPCRIAFDNLNCQNDYINAMEKAVKYGIRYFSNYLLYNYDEKPESLWERLNINIQFCIKYKKISLFSFPMKYASIEQTDRNYVGKWWNRKYLRAINVILNVTSGVVAKEEDFFVRAFGHDEFEFLDILAMPDDFIRYRDFFEKNGLIQSWKTAYHKLSDEEKEELIKVLERMVDEPEILYLQYSDKLSKVLYFYTLSKKKVEGNLLYYTNFVEKKRNNE